MKDKRPKQLTEKALAKKSMIDDRLKEVIKRKKNKSPRLKPLTDKARKKRGHELRELLNRKF